MASNLHRSVALGESQNFQCVELWLVAAAAGTKWSLEQVQAPAGVKVHVATGDGAVDLLSQSEATELVRSASGSVDTQNSSEASSLAADLVVYGTNVPANKVGFVVGGLAGPGQVLGAEIIWQAATGGAVSAARKAGPALEVTSADSPVIASQTLISSGIVGVVAGSIDVTGAAPAAGNKVKLRLLIKG